MPYTTDTYQKAINILQHRRDNATLDLQQRTAEAQSKIPELADIQKYIIFSSFMYSTIKIRCYQQPSTVSATRFLSGKRCNI